MRLSIVILFCIAFSENNDKSLSFLPWLSRVFFIMFYDHLTFSKLFEPYNCAHCYDDMHIIMHIIMICI